MSTTCLQLQLPRQEGTTWPSWPLTGAELGVAAAAKKNAEVVVLQGTNLGVARATTPSRLQVIRALRLIAGRFVQGVSKAAQPSAKTPLNRGG